MERTRVKEEQYIRDEDGVLLRNKGEIRSRWVRFFNTLLKHEIPKARPYHPGTFPSVAGSTLARGRAHDDRDEGSDTEYAE